MALALRILFPAPLLGAVGALLLHTPMENAGDEELHEHVDAAVAEKFGEFIQVHGRDYRLGSREYSQRLALFQQRVADVEAHNQAGHSWLASVNALADWTPEELLQLRGYRHITSGDGSAAQGSVGLIATKARAASSTKLPTDWTWKGRLQAMSDVLDQGGCGSCWAVASSTVLRAHAELYQKDRSFSIQQIIDCVPNPMSCGGTGGCQGATAELAMDYVAKVGLVTSEEKSYKAAESACPIEMKPPTPSLRSVLKQPVSMPEVTVLTGGGLSFGMQGWKKLPVNIAEPLVEALYERGPVVVSVAAASAWNSYASGIMAGCDADAIINHAVALVGYGQEGKYKYWQIQNSWGEGWGERGFVRLLRLDHRNETAFCGWDTKPQDGTGCKGGPDKVKVCGNCGILYDSVVPKFTLSKDGWLARNPRQ